MKLTDEIRAQVYRELADDIDDHSLLSAENLRNRAKEKDQPRPEPGTVVFFDADNSPGIVTKKGIVFANSRGDAQIVYWEHDPIPFKPARIPGPDEVSGKPG